MAVNAFTEGKPNLTSVIQILDPLLSDNFRLEFTGVPNEVFNNGVLDKTGLTPNDALIIQCQRATKPGSQLEPVPVDLFGHSVQYAGRLTFSHSMSIDFVEDRRMIITKSLTNWQRLARQIETQHGGTKKNYACPKATLFVYDQKGGAPTAQFDIINIWPSDVPDVSFDGSSATLITVSCTFTYDYYLDGNVTGTGTVATGFAVSA